LRFDSQVIRDPTLWFFILFTIWLVWEGNKQNRPVLFALASISAGLGALTRVEGFIVWGVLGFYIAFKKVTQIPIKRKVLNLSLFILIFPLLLSVILFSFKKASSEMAVEEMISFSFSFITANVRTILRPQDPIDTMGQKTYDSLPSISQDSLELASRHRIILAIPEVIYKFIKSANLLIILILFGFWKRRKQGLISSDWYAIYVFVALFIMSVFYARQLYYFSTRHGLTLVLPCLFFAGHGLETAPVILSRGMERLGSGWALIRRYLSLILTFLLILIFLFQGMGGRGKEKITIKEAGLWLKNNGYQGSVVMGPKKFLRLAFYADGKFIGLPGAWERVPESIAQAGVCIVIVDSCSIEQDCPGFTENKAKLGFLLIREIKESGRDCLLQIYRVL